jgi:hypothetical protein
VLAVSIRAGAFFMLPFLIIWLGWLVPGRQRIFLAHGNHIRADFCGGFRSFNVLLPRLITEQSGALSAIFPGCFTGRR